MGSHSELLTMYFECTAALCHFEKHYESIQRHTLLFQRNKSPCEYTDTLKKAYEYLKNARWHSLTQPDKHCANIRHLEDFLESHASGAAEEARLQEGLMVNSIIKTLCAIRLCILDDMTTNDVYDLAKRNNYSDIEELLSISEAESKDIKDDRDALAARYAQSTRLSKKDFEKQLTQAEYSKNRRLNKFEENTEKQIYNTVLERFDGEWQKHLATLPQLQVAIAMQETSIYRWRYKIEALRSVAISADKMKVFEVHGKDDRIFRNTSLNDPNVERQQLVRSNISKIVSLENKAVRESIVAETVSPTDALLANTQYSFAVFSPQTTSRHPTETTEPLIRVALPMKGAPNPQSRRILESPDIINTDGSNEGPSATQAASPRTPHTEDSFTFITKREYEYDHNKENRPTISLPIIDKQSASKAFAGIDKYARNLFARSPSLKSPVERHSTQMRD